MDDKPDVRFIYSHSEGDGSDHNLQIVTDETFLNLRAVTISDNMGNKSIPEKDHARLLRALLRRRIAAILKQLENLK